MTVECNRRCIQKKVTNKISEAIRSGEFQVIHFLVIAQSRLLFICPKKSHFKSNLLQLMRMIIHAKFVFINLSLVFHKSRGNNKNDTAEQIKVIVFLFFCFNQQHAMRDQKSECNDKYRTYFNFVTVSLSYFIAKWVLLSLFSR